MRADIPIEIMFENTTSVHLTVYRGNIRQSKRSGQPEYAKNEEWFASFWLCMVTYLNAIK